MNLLSKVGLSSVFLAAALHLLPSISPDAQHDAKTADATTTTQFVNDVAAGIAQPDVGYTQDLTA